MKYLHTMIRVLDPDAAIRFFELLGLREVRRADSEAGRYTLIFLAAPGDEDAQVELTHNWDRTEAYGGGRNFGHLAYRVDDIYAACARLQDGGVAISRPPRQPPASAPKPTAPGKAGRAAASAGMSASAAAQARARGRRNHGLRRSRVFMACAVAVLAVKARLDVIDQGAADDDARALELLDGGLQRALG